MPHADSSLVPAIIESKQEFWDHVYAQLEALLQGQKYWVSNLANASSLIYNALLAFSPHFGNEKRMVNWCGFYIDARFFPAPQITTELEDTPSIDQLLLGPFCGKPACQYINVAPGKARGVCADAYLKAETIVVSNVNLYPGHIACDGETKSEVVCPLILKSNGVKTVIGVLDLDCLALEGFNEEDKLGLEKLSNLIVRSCHW